MLKLSKKVDYAFHLLDELADSKTTLSLSQIATNRCLSPKFLEQIAAKLKSAGLITAKSGASGGYHLARPSRQISLDQVITAIEGDWHVVDCLGSGRSCSCTACSHRPLLKIIESSLRESFSRYTIADLTPPA
jgi:Rrf2 family iron-sulfur cluster assembly transcriptional regulator